jgi:hypothetical protein
VLLSDPGLHDVATIRYACGRLMMSLMHEKQPGHDGDEVVLCSSVLTYRSIEEPCWSIVRLTVRIASKLSLN